MKLALIYGGQSTEHEVSINSAFSVLNNLDFSKYSITPIYITKDGLWYSNGSIKQPFSSIENMIEIHNEDEYVINSLKQFDVIFPLLHGKNGEDGSIQGLLELLGVPYVGNGIFASAGGIDKVHMKSIFKQVGIPQVEYLEYKVNQWLHEPALICEEISNKLKSPFFVKPANLGSSIGISKCETEESLKKALDLAFLYDKKVIVEQGVVAKEVEIALLGNDEIQCSVAGEVVAGEESFYDYETKYKRTSNVRIPANISETTYKQMVDLAKECFKVLDCSGLVRADFFLTDNGNIFMNEVNTMPGFTKTSMYPMLWEKSGLGYSALLDKLISLALDKKMHH